LNARRSYHSLSAYIIYKLIASSFLSTVKILSQLIIASNKTLWSIIDLTDPVTGQEVNNKSNYENRPLASLVTPVTEHRFDHNDPSLGTTRYRDDATPQSGGVKPRKAGEFTR